jgi:hypothetical protein
LANEYVSLSRVTARGHIQGQRDFHILELALQRLMEHALFLSAAALTNYRASNELLLSTPNATATNIATDKYFSEGKAKAAA